LNYDKLDVTNGQLFTIMEKRQRINEISEISGFAMHP